MVNEESPGFKQLPPPVFDEESENNGFELEAHFDMTENASDADVLSVEFSDSAEGLDSNQSEGGIRVYVSLTTHKINWGPGYSLQAEAGATLITDPAAYYSTSPAPDELVNSIPEASVKKEGSNTLSVHVRGSQGEIRLNGTPIGFLNYNRWPKMRYAYAAPDHEDLSAWASYRLKSLRVKRFIPPVAWGMFGFAAFGAFCSAVVSSIY